jgi:hypothetical protein
LAPQRERHLDPLVVVQRLARVTHPHEFLNAPDQDFPAQGSRPPVQNTHDVANGGIVEIA